jgi:hypothetical protein
LRSNKKRKTQSLTGMNRDHLLPLF